MRRQPGDASYALVVFVTVLLRLVGGAPGGDIPGRVLLTSVLQPASLRSIIPRRGKEANPREPQRLTDPPSGPSTVPRALSSAPKLRPLPRA